jgi:hypothetical protein
VTSSPELGDDLANRRVGQHLSPELLDVRGELGHGRASAVELVRRNRAVGQGSLDLAPHQRDETAPVRRRGG